MQQQKIRRTETHILTYPHTHIHIYTTSILVIIISDGQSEEFQVNWIPKRQTKEEKKLYRNYGQIHVQRAEVANGNEGKKEQ